MEELNQREISRELDKNDEESKEELSETDKQFDKNNDGVLDEKEKAEKDKIIQGIHEDAKKKGWSSFYTQKLIQEVLGKRSSQDETDENRKRYW